MTFVSLSSKRTVRLFTCLPKAKLQCAYSLRLVAPAYQPPVQPLSVLIYIPKEALIYSHEILVAQIDFQRSLGTRITVAS